MRGVADTGRGAGDFEPDPVLVRGVIGRMIVGLGDLVDSRGTASALGLIVDVSAGKVGFVGDGPVGVLIVRCRSGTACDDPV